VSADDLVVGLIVNKEIKCESCLTESEFLVLLKGNLNMELKELEGLQLIRISNSDGLICGKCHEQLY